MKEQKIKYNQILKKITQVDSKLIPLKLHIRGIAEYFQSKYYLNNIDIANWFWIASSINSVDFDGMPNNLSVMMCKPIYKYELQKQELHSRLTDELTKFLYVYSGFEALLNYLKLPNCPNNRGKINKAKYHIKTKFTNKFQNIPTYLEHLGLLRNLIKESAVRDYQKYFVTNVFTDYNGIGMQIVYKLRNQLAHGDFVFPEPSFLEPDDWSDLPLKSEIIRVLIRIVLMSIQMIMLGNNKDSFEMLSLYASESANFEELNDEYEINELQFLMYFHIRPKEKNISQLELELNQKNINIKQDNNKKW